MRLEPGVHVYELDDGSLVHVDRRLDRGVLALLGSAFAKARLTPSDVVAVELPDEANPVPFIAIEHLPRSRTTSGLLWRRTCIPISILHPSVPDIEESPNA